MKKNSLFEKVKKHQISLKCLVACLVLWYVSNLISFSKLYNIVTSANSSMLGFALLVTFLNQLLISNTKWSIFLNVYQVYVPFKNLCKMYLTGMFFSLFLPGSYGGDVVRAYHVSRYTNGLLEGMLSVFLERLTGLVGLLVIFLLSLPFIDSTVVSFEIKLWGITFVLLSIAAFFIITSPKGGKYILSLFALVGSHFEEKVKKIHDALNVLKIFKVAILSIGLSIIFQLIAVFTNFLIARALHVDIPFFYLMLTIPVITLISMVPITLSGIGLRDLSYIGLLGALGVESEAAFSIGLLQFMMVVLISLFGGLLYVMQK